MRCLFKRLLLASRSCDIPAESSLHHSQGHTDIDRNCNHNQLCQQFYSTCFFYHGINLSSKKNLMARSRHHYSEERQGESRGRMWRPEKEHWGKRLGGKKEQRLDWSATLWGKFPRKNWHFHPPPQPH